MVKILQTNLGSALDSMMSAIIGEVIHRRDGSRLLLW